MNDSSPSSQQQFQHQQQQQPADNFNMNTDDVENTDQLQQQGQEQQEDSIRIKADPDAINNDDNNDDNDMTTTASSKKEGKRDKKDKKESKKEKKSKKDKKDKKDKKKKSEAVDEDEGMIDDDDDQQNNLQYDEDGNAMYKQEDGSGLDDDSDYEEDNRSTRKKSKKTPITRKRKIRNDDDDNDDDELVYQLTEYQVIEGKPQARLIDINQNESYSSQFFQRQQNQSMINKRQRELDTGKSDTVLLLRSVNNLLVKMMIAAKKDAAIMDHNMTLKDMSATDRAKSQRVQFTALNKLQLYPEVSRELHKSKQLLSLFVQEGVLAVLRLWIYPNPDGSLPPSQIRTDLYKIILSLPMNGSEYIIKSSIGEVLLLLYRHPDETPQNRTIINDIIQNWTRMALRTGSGSITQSVLSRGQQNDDVTIQEMSEINKRREIMSKQSIHNLPSKAEYMMAKRPIQQQQEFYLAPRGNIDKTMIQQKKEQKQRKEDEEKKKQQPKKLKIKEEMNDFVIDDPNDRISRGDLKKVVKHSNRFDVDSDSDY